MRPSKLICSLIAGLALSTAAHAVRITPAHSGSWYDPDYALQGFSFEVLGKAGNGPERTVVVYWYTYDDAGDPVWAIGVSQTEGDTVSLMMQRSLGGARPPVQQPASEMVDWAEMTFTFDTCNRATAEFSMVDGGETGTYELARLTQIGATTCTGGLSDEVPADADPITIVRQFASTGLYPGAQGSVKFKLRPAYAELEVDVRKLPDGDYTVRVDGEDRGSFTSTTNGGGNGIGKGTLTFASPESAGRPLLDFDPQGQLIEIVDEDGEVALTATL